MVHVRKKSPSKSESALQYPVRVLYLSAHISNTYMYLYQGVVCTAVLHTHMKFVFKDLKAAVAPVILQI